VAPILFRMEKWIFCGELVSDMANEFFITESVQGTEIAAWEQHFSINPAKIPFFLTRELAEKVFYLLKNSYYDVIDSCHGQVSLVYAN
jgi:Gamma tubulin complex component N-terminal